MPSRHFTDFALHACKTALHTADVAWIVRRGLVWIDWPPDDGVWRRPSVISQVRPCGTTPAAPASTQLLALHFLFEHSCDMR